MRDTLTIPLHELRGVRMYVVQVLYSTKGRKHQDKKTDGLLSILHVSRHIFPNDTVHSAYAIYNRTSSSGKKEPINPGKKMWEGRRNQE